jgi:hypothetical protein
LELRSCHFIKLGVGNGSAGDATIQLPMLGPYTLPSAAIRQRVRQVCYRLLQLALLAMKRTLEAVPIAPPQHRLPLVEHLSDVPLDLGPLPSNSESPRAPFLQIASLTTKASCPPRPSQAPGLSRLPDHSTCLLAAKVIPVTWQQIQATGASFKCRQKARPVKEPAGPRLVATSKADLASFWETRAARQVLALQAPLLQQALEDTPPTP